MLFNGPCGRYLRGFLGCCYGLECGALVVSLGCSSDTPVRDFMV